MEDSLLVTVQSTDLLKDGRITGEESSVLPPPFSEDNVADILGPFASIDHVSDCLISFAAALACVAAVFPPHLGGNREGLTG